MVDQKSRDRIIREREQKGLISQLVGSLKPVEKPDTLTNPITKVAEGVNRGGNISTILVAFVQAILKTIKEIKDSSPTSSDIKDLKKVIQKLKSTQGTDKNAPELDLVPVIDAIKDLKVDLQKQNNSTLKNDLSLITSAINELNKNVIALTQQLKVNNR